MTDNSVELLPFALPDGLERDSSSTSVAASDPLLGAPPSEPANTTSNNNNNNNNDNNIANLRLPPPPAPPSPSSQHAWAMRMAAPHMTQHQQNQFPSSIGPTRHHPLQSNFNVQRFGDEDEEDEDEGRQFRRIDTSDSMASELEPLSAPPPLQHATSDNSDNWLVERDLDALFRRLYNYYRERGMGSIIASRASDLVTMLFSILSATFLLAVVDWSALAECRDEKSCHSSFSDYLRNPITAESSSFFTQLVMLGFFLFFVNWVSLVLRFLPDARSAIQTRNFYRKHLQIRTRELQTMEWSTVVSRLAQLQRRSRFQINDAPVTALNVALRIMRKENYLIAMVNKGVLPFGSPDWQETLKWSRNAPWWMGQSIEWNLYATILDHIIDPKTFTFNPKSFSADSLRTRLRQFAMINLVLMPFILAFTTVYFFLKYAEEFHAKRNYLGPRWWSPHALWLMREFNELPHYFDRRVHASLRPAERFLRLFPNPVPVVIARCIAFVMGGIVAVLLVMGLYEESILTHVRVGDRNLLWYFAVFSTILAGARALVPAPEDENVVVSPNVQMRRVAAFTHMLPASWRYKAHTFDVRDEFATRFPFRVSLLIRELGSVVCAPYVLGVVLVQRADEIVNFVKKFTVAREGVGDVCTFSLMKLEENGDPVWMNLAGPAVTPPSEDRVIVDGKLEKSWLNFKLQYTVADSGLRDDVGETLLRRVVDFQKANLETVERTGAAPPNAFKPLKVALDWEWDSTIGGADELRPVLSGPSADASVRVRNLGDDFFWWLESWLDDEDAKYAGPLP